MSEKGNGKNQCYICGRMVTQLESFGIDPIFLGDRIVDERKFHLSCKIPDTKPLE